MKHILAIIAVGAFLLLGPVRAGAVGDLLSGPIESVSSHGRIVVEGQTVVVTSTTEIKTPDGARVSPAELIRGVEIEVEVESSSLGTEAVSITAYLLQ